jgi:diguanylate cyclase (GGDEF)-like protein
MGDAKRILIISSDKNLRDVLKFCFDGWGYEVVIYKDLPSDTELIKKLSPDVIVADVHSASDTNLHICRLLKRDFITAYIPVITLIDKRQLRSQLLNLKHGVDDYLIKPPDPLDLRVRVEMAMKRSQYSSFATPLTGLPGGRIIEETLKERMGAGAPFAFGYLDIDNFKYFNDVYGYIKGDRAIMQTAYLLYTVINKFGNAEDFIGHIGGDDFVFITTPDKYVKICHNFITLFNRIMPFHYSAEDRKNGYVVARDRTHKTKNIPLMSVSLSIVNNSQENGAKNIIEINDRVTEVKRYLKRFSGSKFMADRRSGKLDPDRSPKIYKIEDNRAGAYRPLGQALLEKHAITQDRLDEALSIHWRRGVRIGEILKELGFVQEQDLARALKNAPKGA